MPHKKETIPDETEARELENVPKLFSIVMKHSEKLRIKPTAASTILDLQRTKSETSLNLKEVIIKAMQEKPEPPEDNFDPEQLKKIHYTVKDVKLLLCCMLAYFSSENNQNDGGNQLRDQRRCVYRETNRDKSADLSREKEKREVRTYCK